MPSYSQQDLEKIIRQTIGKLKDKDGKLFKECMYCVSRNLSRKESVSLFSKILGKSKAIDFINKLFDATSTYRKRKMSIKPSNKDNIEKKFKSTQNHEKIDSKSDSSPIKEKIKKTEDISIPNRYITEASDKVKQMTFLHSKIQESLAKHGIIRPVTEQVGTLIDPNLSRINVKLNELGQTVDAVTGLPVTLVQHTPTAKINVRIKRKQLTQAVSSEIKKIIPKSNEKADLSQDTAHFDSRIKISVPDRIRKSLKFNEPGKYSQQAQIARKKSQIEKLQGQIQSFASKTGIADATKLAVVTLKHEAEASKTPDIEWWDAAILQTRSYAVFNKIKLNISLKDVETNSTARKQFNDVFEGITCLIEHPVPRLPPGEARDSHALPIFLTKAEQSKIRSQRRRLAEKEKQEKIILGLIPPPPPKVKMSNLMSVLGTEAVQDPTKVEAYVKAQIEARKQAHEEANAARKLTAVQKRAKLIKKYNEDTSVAVHVSVYRIWDLSNRSKRFKLDKNAQQNYITGCVILHQSMNLIVMEGGPKAQKRMKRLLLHRIKWTDDTIGFAKTKSKAEIPLESVQNKCILVWEGTYGYRVFKNWEFKNIESELSAKEFLKKHHADHYWDLALSLTHDSKT